MPFTRVLAALAALILLLSASSASAQVQQRLTATLAEGQSVKRFELPKAGLQALTATWAAAEYPDQLQYRVVGSDQSFGPWQNWSLENEGNPDAASLLLLPGHVRQVEVRSSSLGVTQLGVASYALNKKPALARRALGSKTCNCPSPAVVAREAWCASGDCAPKANAPTLAPEHVIVHHSAQNLGDVDYALVVRAIYDYHTGTNGWDDIGYNLLIAPDGTVFEGRGTSRQGAHFCGANPGTLGICLLGDYNVMAVSRAGFAALRDVSAFVACAEDINPAAVSYHAPSGKTLPGIVGHRGGCATACPGDHLDALVPRLRTEVRQLLDRGCQALPAPSNLVVSTSPEGAPKLAWSAYPGASAIVVERSSGSLADFRVVGETRGDASVFTDAEPAAGTNYYRIRVLKNGFLGDYSNEVIFNSTASFGAESTHQKLRLAFNPTGGALKIFGLKRKVDMAFVSDVSGRTVLELPSGEPQWAIASGKLAQGQYWLMIFSGNEWFTVPFEYQVG